ncbi:hypothetical protein E2C01_005950 [Portunus trituberculatus]|uniref:Uncharacterized protein n=1 Tax=Portunus trituberculatus TaxID=210409 RepID=A0A5B7CVS8_PORTR|nr:hypothetical protein [Portunus trituberculatus]
MTATLARRTFPHPASQACAVLPQVVARAGIVVCILKRRQLVSEIPIEHRPRSKPVCSYQSLRPSQSQHPPPPASRLPLLLSADAT